LGLAQTPIVNEEIVAARGPVYIVLPLPSDFVIPPGIQPAIERLMILVPQPVASSAGIPQSVDALRRRVPTETRIQRRPPFPAPVVLGPNYAYIPGFGWTQRALVYAPIRRLVDEAWNASR